MTALAVTPASVTSSVPGIDPDDELDLSPQTLPSAPYDEHAYENEVEPDYTASDEINSELSFSQSGSDVDGTRSVPDVDGSSVQKDAITADTEAAATEVAAPPTTDETREDTREAGEDKKEETTGDESTFIDNFVDNAKGKVDNCIIA